MEVRIAIVTRWSPEILHFGRFLGHIFQAGCLQLKDEPFEEKRHPARKMSSAIGRSGKSLGLHSLLTLHVRLILFISFDPFRILCTSNKPSLLFCLLLLSSPLTTNVMSCSLDFLGTCSLLQKWYGSSYPFENNPFALSYPLSRIWNEICTDEMVSFFIFSIRPIPFAFLLLTHLSL
jgi:hypothetical protein